MIIKFKIFENNDNIPKVDDYVLCDISTYTNDEELLDFIDKNIGQVVSCYDNNTTFVVKYFNIPKDLDKWYFGIGGIRHFTKDDIILFASTKDELQLKITANKYNI